MWFETKCSATTWDAAKVTKTCDAIKESEKITIQLIMPIYEIYGCLDAKNYFYFSYMLSGNCEQISKRILEYL